jgi:hypothetical protein
MKGLLHKTERGWFVGPTNDISEVMYPLHPKDKEMMESTFTDKSTINVDFEIVKEYTDKHTNQVQSYAKLVKKNYSETWGKETGY